MAKGRVWDTVKSVQRNAETGRAVVSFNARGAFCLYPVDRCDKCQGDMANEAGGTAWITASMRFQLRDFVAVGVQSALGLPACVGYVEEVGGAICNDCWEAMPAPITE